MPPEPSELTSAPRAVGFVELQATPTEPRVTTDNTRIEVLMIAT
jgi:hypothetical protein